MKLLFAILISGLGTLLLISTLPWWFCGVVAFIVCMAFRLSAGQAFLAGLIGVGLAWGISSGLIDAKNDSILSARIGELFGGLSSVLVIILTAILGAITGGLGGWTGGSLGALLWNKPQED
jgi:hypothetical protein